MSSSQVGINLENDSGTQKREPKRKHIQKGRQPKFFKTENPENEHSFVVQIAHKMCEQSTL